jgi:hypothetical protein
MAINLDKIRSLLNVVIREVLRDGVMKHVSYFTQEEARGSVAFPDGKVLAVTIEFVDVDDINPGSGQEEIDV